MTIYGQNRAKTPWRVSHTWWPSMGDLIIFGDLDACPRWLAGAARSACPTCPIGPTGLYRRQHRLCGL